MQRHLVSIVRSPAILLPVALLPAPEGNTQREQSISVPLLGVKDPLGAIIQNTAEKAAITVWHSFALYSHCCFSLPQTLITEGCAL